MNRRTFLKRLGISVAAATPVGVLGKKIADQVVTVYRPRVRVNDLKQTVTIRRGHTIQEYDWSELHPWSPTSKYAHDMAQAMMRARDQEIIEAALGGPDPDAQEGLTLAKLIECKKIMDANELPKGIRLLHPSYL